MSHRRETGQIRKFGDVVAPERDPDADEFAARLVGQPLAVLDPVAPRRQARRPCVVRRVSEMQCELEPAEIGLLQRL